MRSTICTGAVSKTRPILLKASRNPDSITVPPAPPESYLSRSRSVLLAGFYTLTPEPPPENNRRIRLTRMVRPTLNTTLTTIQNRHPLVEHPRLPVPNTMMPDSPDLSSPSPSTSCPLRLSIAHKIFLAFLSVACGPWASLRRRCSPNSLSPWTSVRPPKTFALPCFLARAAIRCRRRPERPQKRPGLPLPATSPCSYVHPFLGTLFSSPSTT